jgi:hypothetical protein
MYILSAIDITIVNV